MPSHRFPGKEDQPFLNEILSAPDDDAPRLIYADWLEERSDPRGEFIRLQCQLEELPLHDGRYDELEQRSETLLKKHRAKWLKEMPKVKDVAWGISGIGHYFRGDRRHFRRGFVEAAAFKHYRAFVANATLFDTSLLREICVLSLGSGNWNEFCKNRALSRLRGLYLAINNLDQGDCKRLFHAKTLAGLKYLSLSENHIGRGGLDILLTSPVLSNLRSLDVSFNGLSNEGWQALLDWKHLAGLRELNLGLNRPLRGIAGLAQSPNIANLNLLNLWSCDLAAADMGDLCGGTSLGNLTHLSLDGNSGIGNDGVALLASSDTFQNLRVLVLSRCGFTDLGVESLANSPALSSLTNLHLAENEIGNVGIQSLANSPHLRNLRTLDLRNTAFGLPGAQSLANSPYLDKLEYLNIARVSFIVEQNLCEESRRLLKDRFGKAFVDKPYD